LQHDSEELEDDDEHPQDDLDDDEDVLVEVDVPVVTVAALVEDLAFKNLFLAIFLFFILCKNFF
jgi:hypothetical protein